MSAPTLRVDLDDGTDTFPHNVTGYVRLAGATVDLTSGRANEATAVEASELTIRFDNNDGRFTPGNPTYGIRRGRKIRAKLTAGAVTETIFTGFLRDLPVVFTSPMAVSAAVTVKATDLFPRFSRRSLRELIAEEILVDRPLAYYALGDQEGSTSGGDTSGTGQDPLAQAGRGTAVSFGTGAGPGLEGSAAAQIAGGKYLTAELDSTTQAHEVVALECWFKRFGAPAAGQADRLVQLWGPDGTTNRGRISLLETGEVEIIAFGTFPSGYLFPNMCDGKWHHAALVLDLVNSNAAFIVDGDTSTVIAGPTGPVVVGRVDVGGGDPAYLTSTVNIAHVAVYNGDQGTLGWSDRFGDHYQAGADGFAGERSDDRMTRLAAYAGLDAGDLDLETGLVDLAAPALNGSTLLSALQATATAEGGTVFVGGDGKLVMHNAQHRVLAATTAPALSLAGNTGDIAWADLEVGNDDQGLVNIAEGSRPNGATQRAINQASINIEGDYPAGDLSRLLVLTDGEVLARVQWIVNTAADPGSRMSQITIDLLTAPTALQEAVLALKLGDHITITDLPAAAGATTFDLIVEGVRMRLSLTEWTVTLNTVAAEAFYAWILGDTTYGVLGTTTRLYV